MSHSSYEVLIMEGLRGLPTEDLAQIASLVYLMRKRRLQPDAFAAELEALRLYHDTRELSRHEEQHLEAEFADFDQRYPPQ